MRVPLKGCLRELRWIFFDDVRRKAGDLVERVIGQTAQTSAFFSET
jgi:hypothetical protein